MATDFAIAPDRVVEIAEEYGTPSYLYDADTIRQRVTAVENTFPEFELFYAVKANPSLSLCALLRQLGVGAEVASGGELLKVRRAGFAPEDIIFVGPGKTDDELELAVDEGIRAVVVESPEELQRLEELCTTRGETIDALLRINTRGGIDESPEQMVGGSSRFGIDEELVTDRVGAIDLQNVRIVGIHAYSASQVLNPDEIINQVEYISTVSDAIAAELGFELEMVDYGGGFGVPYSDDESSLDLDSVSDGTSEAIESLERTYPDFTPAFELGRYFVAEAGMYLTEVLRTKESRGERFAVIDGGMNQFIRPAFTGTEHPIVNVSRVEEPAVSRANVVGKLCTPFDVLAEDTAIAEPRTGDVIGVLNTGAYGFSMSMLNFLSHPWPAELLVTPDETHLIRERGTMADLQTDEELVELER